MQNSTATWSTVWWFLKKLTALLLCDPTITLFGISSKELKSYVLPKTCTKMLIAAVFIIATTVKQPRCPSVDEWINYGSSKQWNIILHEKQWAIKPSKGMAEHEMNITKWKKSIWIGYILYYSNLWHFDKSKTTEMVRWSVVADIGKKRVVNRWSTGFLEQLNYSDGFITLNIAIRTYTQMHTYVHIHSITQVNKLSYHYADKIT